MYELPNTQKQIIYFTIKIISLTFYWNALAYDSEKSRNGGTRFVGGKLSNTRGNVGLLLEEVI